MYVSNPPIEKNYEPIDSARAERVLLSKVVEVEDIHVIIGKMNDDLTLIELSNMNDRFK